MLGLPAFSWCLISSLLLWLSFFPVNAGWLGWIALVPLGFVLQQYVDGTRGTRWFHRPLLSAWLGGLVFCLIAFRWICLASTPMIAVYVGVCLIISLQWLFFFVFTKLLHKNLRVPFVLAAAISWVAVEYFRSQLWFGYSWYYLSHTQHDELYFIQAADLAGAFGLSFIMAMVNMALARLILQRSLNSVTWELIPAVLLVGIACWYGSMRLAEDAEILPRPQTPRIAVLQGNQPQDLRNDAEKWKTIDRTYFELGEEASRFHPELMIAPETCLSHTWMRLKDDTIPEWALKQFPRIENAVAYGKSWAKQSAERWRSALLFGFNTYDLRGDSLRHTNSALMINREGQQAGIYDKIVCLPFGEYIPWAETLPFMKLLSPYPYEYTVRPGTEVNVLEWQRYRLGVLICYEDSVHNLCRQFVLEQNPSFFVNMSNDGWFKGSEEHEQHLVNARFRCIENRRSMVRAVNMGVSCIIDGMGRMVALPTTVPMPEGDKGAISAYDVKSSHWRETKDRTGILIGSVPIYTQLTLYTRFGDLLPWACWALVLVAVGMSIMKRRRTTPTPAASLDATSAAATPDSLRR